MLKPEIFILYIDNLNEKKELNTKHIVSHLSDRLLENDYKVEVGEVDLEKGSALFEFLSRDVRFRYIIIIIDHVFLSIKAALAELALFAENIHTIGRVLPIIFPDVKSHKPLLLIDYNYYWDSEITYLKQKQKDVLNPYIIQHYKQQLDLYIYARKTVANLASFCNSVFYENENLKILTDLAHHHIRELLDLDLQVEKKESELIHLSKIPSIPQKKLFDGYNRMSKLHEAIEDQKVINLYTDSYSSGKTFLARAFVNNDEFTSGFKYLIWIDHSENIQLDIINQISGKHTEFKIDLEDTIHDNFNRLLTKLDKLNEKSLLVIDNLQNLKKDTATINQLMNLQNWNILFISRTISNLCFSLELPLAKQKEIISLLPEEEEIYSGKIREFLVQLTDNHYFLIDFFVKQIQNSKKLSSLKIYQFIQMALRMPSLRKINEKTSRFSKMDIQRIQILDFFIKQEKFSNLQIILLQIFSIFPNIEQEEETLNLILTKIEQNQDLLKKTLSDLSKSGWIINNHSNFHMPNLMKAAISENFPLDNNIQKQIINGVINLLKSTKNCSYSNRTKKLQTCLYVSNSLTYLNEEFCVFSDLLSNEFLRSHNYSTALPIAIRSLKIKKTLYPKNSEPLAKAYNKVALIHGYTGNINKELEFALKALFIRRKTLTEDHLDLAQSYNNVAISFRENGEYSKALKYHLRDIHIITKKLDKMDTSIATSFYETAITYYYLKDYIHAEEFIGKALKIWQATKMDDYSDLKNALEIQEIIKRKTKGNTW